jgi:GNAT superfamily N-acetyltransferase
VRVDEPSPEFARFLYTAVGSRWYWRDRLHWALAEWTEQLGLPGTETWVSWINGTPAGYVELAAESHEAATHVRIAYFGLLPRFIGRGLGGQLLTHGVHNAWTLRDRWPELAPVTRVRVHTCTLDGPHALGNYVSRGFAIYRETTNDVHLPDTPPEPWPGADSAG